MSRSTPVILLHCSMRALAILAQCRLGSKSGSQLFDLPAQAGSKRLAPSRLSCGGHGMGARAKQLMNKLRGTMGECGAGGRTPPPRLLQPSGSTGRGVELFLWVLQFRASFCVFSCKKPKATGGRSPAATKTPRPEAALVTPLGWLDIINSAPRILGSHLQLWGWPG